MLWYQKSVLYITLKHTLHPDFITKTQSCASDYDKKHLSMNYTYSVFVPN